VSNYWQNSINSKKILECYISCLPFVYRPEEKEFQQTTKEQTYNIGFI